VKDGAKDNIAKDLFSSEGFSRADAFVRRIGTCDAETVLCAFAGMYAGRVSDSALLIALAVLFNSVGEDVPELP